MASQHQLLRSIAPLGTTPVTKVTAKTSELIRERLVLDVIDGPTGHHSLALTRKGLEIRETPE